MLFPTVTFALFFAIVFPLSWLTMPHQRVWRLFIVAASYVFYGYWDWHFVFLLVLSTFWNQGFALAIHREQREGMRKALLAVAVAGNLGPSATSSTTTSSSARPRTWPSRTGIAVRAAPGRDHPADRDLVLHLPGAQLRHRHLPARRSSRSRCSTSRSTCRSSRTSSPGRSCGPRSSSRSCTVAARPALHRRLPRLLR